MKLTDWKGVSDEGALPEELLPCSYIQYRWRVLHQFVAEGGSVMGGNLSLKMEFDLKLGDDFTSKDKAQFLLAIIPLGFGDALYSYDPQEITTTGPDTTPVFTGKDMYWEYADNLGGEVSEGAPMIDGWLVSPVYKMELPQGTVLDVTKHFPLQNDEGWGWYLEFRTSKAQGGGMMQSLNDPATGNEIHLQAVESLLVCSIKMSAQGILHGRERGMEVTVAGGFAAIAPGVTWVDFRRFTTEEPAIVSVASGTNYVIARVEAGALVFASVQAVPAEPHTLIAIVSGAKVTQTITGSMVAAKVSDFGGLRREGGALRCRLLLSGSAAPVFYESGNYGMSWAAVEG